MKKCSKYMIKHKILAIDDDSLVTQSLRLMAGDDWLVVPFQKETPGYYSSTYHVAFIDMHLSGDVQKFEGIRVIRELRGLHPELEIVAMSGNMSLNLMEKALDAGASLFLAKPLIPEEVRLTLSKVEAHLLLKGAHKRASQLKHPWIGTSESSQKIKKQVASFNQEQGPILIEGEPGTGKEVVAQLIHELENRGPWIVVNVAAIPENLFESELFGHVKGAFTGAETSKMGLAEAAHGGDLFLDEIETLSLNSQAKLLRFLETGDIRRVGSKDSTRVSIRLIAATNRNLERLVKEGKFREDLLWRLNGKKILISPLRDRKEDVEPLVNYFLEKEKIKRNKSVSPDTMKLLQEHDWPGNVREVRRVIEQACLQSPLPVIRPQDIAHLLRPRVDTSAAGSSHLNFSLGLTQLLLDYEAAILKKCLETYSDIDKAAEVLQISRSSIYKKLKDHGISK